MKRVYLLFILLLSIFLGCSSKQHAFEEPGLYISKDSVKPHPKFVPEKDLPMYDPKLAYFDTNKSILRPEARKALVPTADYLKKNPKVNLVVEGYCDERGSDEYNLALGERRASATKDFLVAHGVNEDRVRTVSYGRIMGREVALMAKNRRVGFQLIYPTFNQ